MKAVQHGRRDRIRAQLADLNTPGALEALAVVLSEVDGGEASPAEAIERLLRAQISLRNDRTLVKAATDNTAALFFQAMSGSDTLRVNAASYTGLGSSALFASARNGLGFRWSDGCADNT
jgi:hypothetical protein